MESVLEISAHKYGNYHKYYTFHPSETRSSFFAGEELFLKMWEAQGSPAVFAILDIGCNEGNLSIDMLEQAAKELPHSVKCFLLGIDVDSSLIALANTKYTKEIGTGNVQFSTVNIMDEATTNEFMSTYFKSISSNDLPCSGFSVASLFSITMWIHLNHGDSGLVNCLKRSSDLLTPLGSLIVEPQPWKCYKSADKRCRKLGITRPLHYSELQIREIEVDVVNVMLPIQQEVQQKQDTDTEIGNEAPSSGAGKAEVETKTAKAKAKAAAVVSSNESNRQARLAALSKGTHMGMHSYWNLGKEGWGRSIFIFHRSPTIKDIQPICRSSGEEKEKESTSHSKPAVPSADESETKRQKQH
jgi:SAM-dependent methyltransferase